MHKNGTYIYSLSRYNFKVIEIHANGLNNEGRHTWQYPKSELDKLKNTNLMIVTDDVYGTFADNFKSLMNI